MRLKNIIAAVAAAAFCTVSFVSVAASAGEVKNISCSNASALGLGDEGNALRRNIYNVWGNSVEDIDPNTPVSEYIKIDFTISGIGSDDARKDADSSTKYDADGVKYYAFIGGSIAGVSRHSISGSDASTEYTPITGDGDYTVTWTLDAPSENISCLYLQTNIDFTEYVAEADRETAEKEKNIDASGITIKINSITSVEPDKEEESSETSGETKDGETTTTEAGTTTTAAETTTTAAATTTTAAATTTKAVAVTTAKSAATTAAATTAATSVSTVSDTPTGDTSGVVAVAVVLTAAGAAAVVSRKKD